MDKSGSVPSFKRSDLSIFYDDLEEFNDYCSFLCDAMSALFCEYQDSEPDLHTILGARRQLSWVKCRAEQLKNELQGICQGAAGEDKVTPLKPADG